MKRLRRFIEVCLVTSGVSLSAAAAASTRPQSQMPVNDVRGLQQTPNSETDELLRSAYTLFRQGKLDESLANLKKAASLSPNDFRPMVLSGYVYSAQRKMKSASESFAAAIRLQPRRA
jgi:Tfp pilus assembly protein PilF